MISQEEHMSNVFDSRIPGQSLTDDPETPRPWERPPTFTDPKEALAGIMSNIFQEDAIQHFSQMLRDGVPVNMITRVVVFSAFTDGWYTPDIALVLYEPVAAMFIKLAEKLGIDPVLYPGEDTDMSVEDELDYFRHISAEKILEGNVSESEQIEEAVGELEQSLLGGPDGGR